MKAIKFLFISFSLLFGSHVRGQVSDIDSDLSHFFPFLQRLHQFSRQIPQEKVYLHFDNTSYYQGDNIWFKCYVTSAQHQLSRLSKTLYVELLNPGGEVIDKRILPVENGQCHGDFSLTRYPFYSGFYEIRAYTKYMLNFGDDVIFSRLLPVFDKPEVEGDFAEKRMLAYDQIEMYRDITHNRTGSYPMKRERPERGRTVNLRFYPEGGNMVQGVASRVAFEATDETGNPIDVSGAVLDVDRQELCSISAQYEGRGIFTYTPPVVGRQRSVAEVEYAGRNYRFDLPAAFPQGVVMEVDNLSHPDSIGITLRKNSNTVSKMLGVVILSGGIPQKYCFARIEDKEIAFRMDKTQLPAGVSQIVLFGSQGEIICDRLVFAGKNEGVDIQAKTDKPAYRPYEPVSMEFSVFDNELNPVNTTFSLSVRDGANEVEGNHNILTDLLLMSEIKGYVRNPAYYFEDDDVTHRSSLDLLLMVQGWRRYDWKQVAGIEPVEIRYRPEQGIETHGQIFNFPLFGKPSPKSDVDVSLFLSQRDEDEDNGGVAIATEITDRQGRFAFVTDVQGRWSMILSAAENGKQKDFQIRLDRLFSPDPKRYNYSELQVNMAENNTGAIKDKETVRDFEQDMEDDYDSILTAYADSIAKLGLDEKIHQLQEVTVTARRRTREQDIFNNRSTSVVYYDVQNELDNLYDSDTYTGRDIQQILVNMNPNFDYISHLDLLLYKNKLPLFIINYERSKELPPSTYSDFFTRSTNIYPINLFGAIGGGGSEGSADVEVPYGHRVVNPNAIKSIFINEIMEVIYQYINIELLRVLTYWDVERLYGCVVFIETYEEQEIYADDAKGVRKTWLDGYSTVREFYSPDYSALPPAPDDYRRTLYWNPSVTSDRTGHASVRFYNNSRSRNFHINAETVTPSGLIGFYKE